MRPGPLLRLPTRRRPRPEKSNDSTPVNAEYRASLLGGVTALRGREASGPHASRAFKAVPYYAWANRGQGWMTVWIPEIGPGKWSRPGIETGLHR